MIDGLTQRLRLGVRRDVGGVLVEEIRNAAVAYGRRVAVEVLRGVGPNGVIEEMPLQSKLAVAERLVHYVAGALA